MTLPAGPLGDPLVRALATCIRQAHQRRIGSTADDRGTPVHSGWGEAERTETPRGERTPGRRGGRPRGRPGVAAGLSGGREV
jgi:hypothetical protein